MVYARFSSPHPNSIPSKVSLLALENHRQTFCHYLSQLDDQVQHLDIEVSVGNILFYQPHDLDLHRHGSPGSTRTYFSSPLPGGFSPVELQEWVLKEKPAMQFISRANHLIDLRRTPEELEAQRSYQLKVIKKLKQLKKKKNNVNRLQQLAQHDRCLAAAAASALVNETGKFRIWRAIYSSDISEFSQCPGKSNLILDLEGHLFEDRPGIVHSCEGVNLHSIGWIEFVLTIFSPCLFHFR
jgi:hypothetical protein